MALRLDSAPRRTGWRSLIVLTACCALLSTLPCPAARAEVEDKLEEQEPGRKHLSGYYKRRGHDTMVDGQRRPLILLVGALACLPAAAWALRLGLKWPRRLPACAPCSRQPLPDACLPICCVVLLFSHDCRRPLRSSRAPPTFATHASTSSAQTQVRGARAGRPWAAGNRWTHLVIALCEHSSEYQHASYLPWLACLLVPCDHPSSPQPLLPPRHLLRRYRAGAGSADSMTLQLLSEKGYVRMEQAEAEVLWKFWFDHTARATEAISGRHVSEAGSCASWLTQPACAARWPRHCRRQLLSKAPWVRMQHRHAQAQHAPRLRRRAARLVRHVLHVWCPSCCSSDCMFMMAPC